jgi:hypothetical protein
MSIYVTLEYGLNDYMSAIALSYQIFFCAATRLDKVN